LSLALHRIEALDTAAISRRPGRPGPNRKAARAGARFPDGSLTGISGATHDARHQKNLGANKRSPMRKKIPGGALLRSANS
jgi:hypothetical protein